jgi:4-diphosphocytidyl-2-C-methyl-D-erythritol kinase
MIVFPNAKINIGLNIIEKLADGYHNIESCIYPVPWYDALEVIVAKKFSFITTGIDIPGKENICLSAYELLENIFDLPPVRIHLHKNIPIGAGLGGGSADGAFMLKLLNDKFSLGLNKSQLRSYAGQLGSDCPFFIENQPALVEGTGDIITPIDIDLHGLFIGIIYPEIHINTKSAYDGMLPSLPSTRLKEVVEGRNIANWHQIVTNDFEQNADKAIHVLKEMLYAKGAMYASMTGSGSAVYGLFKSLPELVTEYPHILSEL